MSSVQLRVVLGVRNISKRRGYIGSVSMVFCYFVGVSGWLVCFDCFVEFGCCFLGVVVVRVLVCSL